MASAHVFQNWATLSDSFAAASPNALDRLRLETSRPSDGPHAPGEILLFVLPWREELPLKEVFRLLCASLSHLPAQLELSSPRYSMTSIPRGKAVIINVAHFDPGTGLTERLGAQKDAGMALGMF